MYILTLVVMLLIYGVFIYLMKRFANTKLTNVSFCFIAFILYLSLVLVVYLDVGFYDWNFQNTLPVANVSPFMFFVSPFCLILPTKARKYFFTLVSLLSIGMLLSPLIGCIRNQVINYAFHPHFLLDYFAHLSLSLWGIYLYLSNQTLLKVKDNILGGSIIVIVALIMLILNVIFDTAFFGLSLNGKHNIYNVVLVDSSYLSVLIYFICLIIVLIIGYFYLKLIKRITKNAKC